MIKSKQKTLEQELGLQEYAYKILQVNILNIFHSYNISNFKCIKGIRNNPAPHIG